MSGVSDMGGSGGSGSADIPDTVDTSVCETPNNIIIFVVFLIILLSLVISLIILLLNIVNYTLFTVYCISDSITDSVSDNPDGIILEKKYKYRLLNYVKNTFDNNRNKKNTDKSNIDKNASDLFISKTIQYYNYIVKLVLLIIFVILMGFLYNIFRIGITVISQCDKSNCNLIITDILQKDTYIYYILLIICIYAYVHSYVYTYFFNKNIYKELYAIYDEKYKKIDTILSYSINYINDNELPEAKDAKQDISLYLRDLKELSYDILEPLVKDAAATEASLTAIMKEGSINNSKFVIPIELEENEGNLNNLFKKIYKTPIANITDDKKRELLVHKIMVYLVYHYVITNNTEDPLIIHKMNNIFLNLFENLFEQEYKKDDPNYFLEQRYDINVRAVLREIRGAYTIKLLLPAATTKEDLTAALKKDAELIVKYIKEYDKKITRQQTSSIPEGILLGEINNKIDVFAEGFFDYFQEDKTPGDINRVVYKINLYLAIEMMETIFFIVIVLLILYNSGKYPYLEEYINTAITYAIAIINELISAILGII
jgi:hypothetical protein